VTGQAIISFIQKFPGAYRYIDIALWGTCFQIQDVLRNTILKMQMEFYVVLKKQGLGVWTIHRDQRLILERRVAVNFKRRSLR
jgi:hypothetical protein